MVKDQLDMLNGALPERALYASKPHEELSHAWFFDSEVLGDLCANTKSEDMDMSTGADGADGV